MISVIVRGICSTIKSSLVTLPVGYLLGHILGMIAI